MAFSPERLIALRTAKGISKAEAARQLHMSAMGYGRYESGEREPSYQTVSYIAQYFGTTADYLLNQADSSDLKSITVSAADEPELFEIISAIRKNPEFSKRMLDYYRMAKKNEN